MTPPGMVAAAGLTAPSGEPRGSMENPRRIAEAAQQFEALLIGQMLKSMHESDDGGWSGTDNDDAGAQVVELAEEQLAQAIARHGGLGLAQVVMRGLTPAGAPEGATPNSQKLQPRSAGSGSP